MFILILYFIRLQYTFITTFCLIIIIVIIGITFYRWIINVVKVNNIRFSKYRFVYRKLVIHLSTTIKLIIRPVKEVHLSEPVNLRGNVGWFYYFVTYLLHLRLYVYWICKLYSAYITLIFLQVIIIMKTMSMRCQSGDTLPICPHPNMCTWLIETIIQIKLESD